MPAPRQDCPAPTVRLEGSGSSCGLDYITSTTSKSASNEWQRRADKHNDGNNVKCRLIINACDQQGTDNTTGAPGCQHCTINCSRVLWAEEVGGEGRHRTKAAPVAKTDDGRGNE